MTDRVSRDDVRFNGVGLVLLESAREWILSPKFDPRLSVGTVFEHLGIVWTVTWDSADGFGPGASGN